jgi:hypothetical protein
MGIGDEWTSSQIVTRGKLNQMTVVSGLAAYINGLTKSKNRIYLPEDAGGGLNAYNLYAYDGSVMRNLSNPPHGHSGDTDGGTIAYGGYLNSKWLDTIALFLIRARTAEYIVTNDGAGSSTADDNTTTPDSMKHTAGAVANGRSYIKLQGEKVDFNYQIYLACLVKITTITNVSWNMGVNCEWAGDTADVIRKVNFDFCTSVNGNYFIVSADGTTRTSTDTGYTVVSTGDDFMKFLFTPAVKIDWAIDNIIGIKTTNVPASGNGTDRTKCFTTGIKTTASAQSIANNFGPRLICRAYDQLY